MNAGKEEDYNDEPEQSFSKSYSVSAGAPQVPVYPHQRYEAISDFDAIETNDLPFHKGDVLKILATRSDGWWHAQNESGVQGMVPSTYLKLQEPYEEIDDSNIGTTDQRPSGKRHWSSLRKSLDAPTVGDVLRALGAMPAGFRLSYLASMEQKSHHYSLSCYLTPRLSESQLGFHDLFWNAEGNKPRKRHAKVLKLIKLVRVDHVPFHLAGVEAVNRYVKVCLFDGKQPVSNIVTIQAQYNVKKPHHWTFIDKMNDKHSSIEYSEVFIRSNYSSQEIVVLFEVGVAYIRPAGKQRGELSCGWVTVPLLNDSGVASIGDKTHTLMLKGGTPFEPEVEVDPSQSMSVSTSKLQQMVSSNLKPRLVVKVASPTQAQTDKFEYCNVLPCPVTGPDVLVWNPLFGPFLAYYRRLLGEVLLRDRPNISSTEIFHDLFLSVFPKLADEPDFMDLLRALWQDLEKSLKKDQKHDDIFMCYQFRKLCEETVCLLHDTAQLPQFALSNQEALEIRRAWMQKFLEQYRKEKTSFNFLTSLDNCLPLDPFDFTVNIIGQHAIG